MNYFNKIISLPHKYFPSPFFYIIWINCCHTEALLVISNLHISTVPSSPLALSVSPVPGSPNQLSASWSPPIPKNGIITAYTVYCNTSASQAYPEQMIGPNVPTVRSVVNGSTLAVTFNAGPNPYTQYDCYVTANTSVGEGKSSMMVTSTTVESSKQMHCAK